MLTVRDPRRNTIVLIPISDASTTTDDSSSDDAEEEAQAALVVPQPAATEVVRQHVTTEATAHSESLQVAIVQHAGDRGEVDDPPELAAAEVLLQLARRVQGNLGTGLACPQGPNGQEPPGPTGEETSRVRVVRMQLPPPFLLPPPVERESLDIPTSSSDELAQSYPSAERAAGPKRKQPTVNCRAEGEPLFYRAGLPGGCPTQATPASVTTATTTTTTQSAPATATSSSVSSDVAMDLAMRPGAASSATSNEPDMPPPVMSSPGTTPPPTSTSSTTSPLGSAGQAIGATWTAKAEERARDNYRRFWQDHPV